MSFGLALLGMSVVFGLNAAEPAFEVASVRAIDLRVPEPIDMEAFPGGRFVATNCTVRVLMMGAYGVQQYQVLGGPAWIDDERFDITANSAPEALPGLTRVTDAMQSMPEGMKPMLQALLAERFKLRVHREARDGTVYDLTADKGPSKLGAATPSDASWVRFRRAAQDGTTLFLDGRKASMTLLAERLGAVVLRAPVTDRTGLPGEFDFRAEYAVDGIGNDMAPPLSVAIRDLGLRLEPRKGKVDILVIDSADRPTGN